MVDKKARKPKSSGYKTSVPSARTKEYWIQEQGCDEEEAIKMAKSRTPGMYEYYTIFKELSHEDALISSKKYYDDKAYTLENLVKKFGDVIGNQKWESYCTKQAKSNGFEYKRDKHGWTWDQFVEYNKARSQTLENMINRHGEDVGRVKWQKYVERQSYAGVALEYFVEKYGEEIGKSILTEINLKKTTVRNNESNSMISSQFINDLIGILNLNVDEIRSFNYGGEEIIIVNNSVSMVDFYHIPTKTVIEFFGDYWHANPLKYKSDTVFTFTKSPSTAEEIWKKDAARIERIKRCDLVDQVLIIWEYDYKQNKTETLEKCKKLLIG